MSAGLLVVFYWLVGNEVWFVSKALELKWSHSDHRSVLVVICWLVDNMVEFDVKVNCYHFVVLQVIVIEADSVVVCLLVDNKVLLVEGKSVAKSLLVLQSQMLEELVWVYNKVLFVLEKLEVKWFHFVCLLVIETKALVSLVFFLLVDNMVEFVVKELEIKLFPDQILVSVDSMVDWVFFSL